MKHTKYGRTRTEIITSVGGPSRMKEPLVVPANTLVYFIGRWVVQDLQWLAKLKGVKSVVYHDADHYGIDIDPENVIDIREVP
jgi:hypothetical protein